jgi:GAF domain-containing protein
MASSGDEAELLELFELQHDEGPCLDCYRTGELVVSQGLGAADTPWPRFAPFAVDAGFRSVHALSMRPRDTVVGSLNLFGTDPRPLSQADLQIAQALADVATISIVQDRAMHDANALADQLGRALNRVLIEQAKGMLAERCQIDMQEVSPWSSWPGPCTGRWNSPCRGWARFTATRFSLRT